MHATGKHRRVRNSALVRRLVAVGAGGAALALPVIGAATAHAAPAAAPVAAVAAVAQAKAATAAPASYSVVLGDTLSKIARAHQVSGGWKSLYEANRSTIGADPSLIRPGLRLAVGAKAAAAPAVAKTAAKTAAPAAAKPAAYADNLDGWIREALDVMAENGIPGSYDGIHRNIMRESAGNPLAINNWDVNAVNGTPSKGLLQVIDPTFQAYHVAGTSTDSYDPVANIVAACNYAADRYGSIDNVNGPY
ncbi:peptidoglycan-binding protein [Streptomyces solincola]|uniref:Peptidoglycan-binding protein n=1 Tax=Streptomyces solincola TaxID=2100817 RepID=A0A2S9PRX3_9ACTN|nr:LysM peptidoglycan-binding domain-containing protein [Streptomyces solincola]PRH77169.1 peptidoglycan-binding protein [Streptomyces solincola]